jgi:uncharacterized protein YndB with AHSA1/START domain
MASAYELSVEIAAPPDEVWALVGDPVGVPRWFTKYVGAEIDGDTRILRRADGGELVERLLDRDDEARRYSYSVTAGSPLRTHHASFEVRPAGAGSIVVWRTEAEFQDPAIDAEERLAGGQRDALQAMKALLEGSA